PSRRGGRRHRSQRRGQDNLDAGRLRPDPADCRNARHGRRRSRGHSGASDRRARGRPRPGESPPVPAHDGRGQSEDGRLRAGRAPEVPPPARGRLRAVPADARAPPPARRQHVGRRAADVRDRARADVRAEAAPPGRAVRGAGAGSRRAGVRAGQPHPRQRPDRADRRAERAAGAPRGRPRLFAQDGAHSHRRAGRRAPGERQHPRSVPRSLRRPRSLGIFDIFLLEAVINGLLLGGVLALLSLGLNLVFGVIDVVWICYAELIMLGMYGMYFLYTVYHAPIVVAGAVCIVCVGILGLALHALVIAPLLGAAPINQLLATGGVLFFLQSAATVLFGIEFKNLGLRLPVLKVAGMFVSYSRLLAFGAALIAMVLVYLLLTRTYTGAAIRA